MTRISREARTPPPGTGAARWLDFGGEDLVEVVGRMLQHFPGMFYRRDLDGRWPVELASPGCRALTGFAPEDLREHDRIGYLDLVHPDDRVAVEAAVQSAATKSVLLRQQYRILGVDGKEHSVYDVGQFIVGAHGRRQLEGLVVEAPASPGSDAQLRALVEQSLAGVYLIRAGRFTYVNDRFSEIFGQSVSEILALPSVLELVHPADRDLVAGNLQRRLDRLSVEVRYQFRGLTAGGGTVEVEVHGRRVELDGIPHVLGTLLDVSERVQAERLQREAEKLEALRRLAAGVAHDLNNFLSTVRTTADVLRLERSDDAALIQDLDAIVAAVDDGAHLSRQLTQFGRRGETGMVSLPSRVLEELAQSIRHILGKRFEVRTHIQPDLPAVAMTPGDLEELMTNLVLNAQDAMAEGGVLTLAAYLLPSGVDGNVSPSVILEVADAGRGISSSDRNRAFDPHFTTKGARRTGLGLAIVAKLVRDAGGEIQIGPGPVAGTAVRIAIPPATLE